MIYPLISLTFKDTIVVGIIGDEETNGVFVVVVVVIVIGVICNCVGIIVVTKLFYVCALVLNVVFNPTPVPTNPSEPKFAY
jgi:hypothetical protein